MCERAIPAPDPAPAPHRPAPGSQGQPADADALAELEFHWGSAYHLAVIDGVCTARRRDGRGGTLTDPDPEGLRLQIVADHVRVLHASGGTYRGIAAAAGLAPSTVRDLATGRRPATPYTTTALLAVTTAPPPRMNHANDRQQRRTNGRTRPPTA